MEVTTGEVGSIGSKYTMTGVVISYDKSGPRVDTVHSFHKLEVQR